MFSPRYTISNVLLANIKRINSLVMELNDKRFPRVVLVELTKTARAVSSFASTSIEGNPLPLTEVKKILQSAPAHIRESEKEVLNYNEALKDLERKLTLGQAGLTPNLLLKIHRRVMTGLLPASDWGKLRQKPVVVREPLTNQIVYLPPDDKDVKPLLLDLLEFVKTNKATIDPLILAGIFHKELVVIHPFMDGNGRTARLATKVLLAEMGLNTFNLFSFENYYNQNVTRYFQTVGEKGNYYDLKKSLDFTEWLEYFTEGIIDELLRVQKILPQTAISPETALRPHHQKILKFIREKGFISDRDYAQLVDRARATRALDFQKLIELELIERKGKGRATYYTLKSV